MGNKAIKLVTNLIKDSMNVNEIAPSTGWYSTGCTLLDLAITNSLPGGIAAGRITQIYGGASSCKSVIACTIVGAALRRGALGFYADAEATLDAGFAAYYGLDIEHDNFYLNYAYDEKLAKKLMVEGEDLEPNQIKPSTVEEFFDIYLAGIFKKYDPSVPKVIVIDSLTCLPSMSEVKKGMDEQGFGGNDRAKKIGLGLRKFNDPLAANNAALFIVDQARDNIGVTFGDSETTTGGRGPEYYTSTRIYTKHETKVLNAADEPVGIWVKFEIKKNKVGKPFGKGSFKIDFDLGLDDIHTNLRYLAEKQSGKKTEGLKKTAKVTLTIPDENNSEKTIETTKTIKAWISYIEEHDLEMLLEHAVWEQWKKLHPPSTRKKKEWK